MLLFVQDIKSAEMHGQTPKVCVHAFVEGGCVWACARAHVNAHVLVYFKVCAHVLVSGRAFDAQRCISHMLPMKNRPGMWPVQGLLSTLRAQTWVSKVCTTQLTANQNRPSCITTNEESARNLPGLIRWTKPARATSRPMTLGAFCTAQYDSWRVQ